MADYPSLVKSWQFYVNQPIAQLTTTATANNQNLLWAIYQSLLGVGGTLGTNPWTIVGSQGFGSASALTWANNGTTHSWVILKQTGIASNFQILISCSGSGANSFILNFWFSPSTGFNPASGSATNDPTIPLDASQVITNGAWGAYSAVYQYKVHALASSDGACTRIAITAYSSVSVGPVCCGYLSIEVPQGPVTGWTNPAHVLWLGSSGVGQVLTLNNLYQTYSGFGRAAANFSLIWTGENISGTLITAAYSDKNDLNQEYPIAPIGMYSNTTGSKGRHGAFFDLWWGFGGGGGSYNPFGQPGTPFNGAAPNAFVQIGAIVLPWNGTAIQMS